MNGKLRSFSMQVGVISVIRVQLVRIRYLSTLGILPGMAYSVYGVLIDAYLTPILYMHLS